MAVGEIKFNFKDLIALDTDLDASKRAIPIIVQRSLTQEFRALRNELRPQIPRKTGAIRRHFSFSVRRFGQIVRGRLGFIAKTTQKVAIAANVMQHGSRVTAKKAAYLWIPIGGNRGVMGEPLVTPRQVFADREHYFVGMSSGGNLLAFRKDGDSITPIFALKKTISVRPRPIPFEQRTIERTPEITAGIERLIAETIEAKRAAQRVIANG